MPLFQGAGEFQGSVYLTTGIDVQAGAALTDHIGVIGSYSFLNENQPAQNFVRKNRFAEAGIGVFNATRQSRVELYAGYGVGEGTSYSQYYFFTDDFGLTDIVATGKFNRFFIQPSIGSNNPNFNLAFTPRISIVNFTEFTSSGIKETPDEKPQLMIEPAITSKFRLIGNLYGVFQLNLNVKTSEDIFFDYVPLQAAMGIQLHVGNTLRTRVY